jgi:hypothetical protein
VIEPTRDVPLGHTPEGRAHFVLRWSFLMLNGKEEHREARERFVWAKADFSKLSDHISSINWYDIFDGMSVNNCYVLFVQEYENACAEFIPKSTKTITDDKDPCAHQT